MKLTPTDLSIMRNALLDLESNLADCGPCDHDVGVCTCHTRTNLVNLADLFHRMTNGQVGYRAQREPDFDMVDFARDILEQSNVMRIAQLKAEADARNAQFRKGTIND